MNKLRPSDVLALEEMITALKDDARLQAADSGRMSGRSPDLEEVFGDIDRMSVEQIVDAYRNRLRGYASGRGF